MIDTGISALGLLIIHLSDPASMKRLPIVKPAAWLIGGALLVFSVVRICLAPEKVILPAYVAWVGWVLLVASILGLAYSLFVNLPFFKTYVASGVGERLVTSGFYALVRHPGVLWAIVLVVSLFMVSQSRLMIVSGPVFIFLDILAVVIQDRFFFPRMFAGYDVYRKETPMLIPNRKSARAFVNSMRHLDFESKTRRRTHVESR